MCGIAGFVGHAEPDLIASMARLLAHRGPDDMGTWFLPGTPAVGLANTRLAIQDLSHAGHQPMEALGGAVQIVLNGEIYNFPELRVELERAGTRFRSHSDTEVVLELYLRNGMQLLERLNGMFALAIWDNRTRELFLARDRFGEKPCYLLERPDGLYFASEVKALLSVPGFQPALDPEALLRYLTFLWVPEPDSMFTGVRKLPAAHYAVYRAGRLALHRYWDLPLDRHAEGDVRDWVAEVRRLTVQSVRRRLVSDRPIGAFLSGGVDSSTMLAAMVEASPEPVQTYTIGFRPEDFRHERIRSEVAEARRVAEHLGARWEQIELDAQIADLLPTIVWHMDEPVADPAATTAYLLCKTAKQSRTVLLSGAGGDEMFGGYRRHVASQLTDRFLGWPSPVRATARGMAAALAAVRPHAARVRDLRHFLRNAELPFERRFIGYARYYAAGELEEMIGPTLRGVLAGVDVEARHREHLDASRGADALTRMLHADMKTFMPSLNLLYMDKMSMASAVETRLPFLDHELAEFAATLPANVKIRGMTTKWILREAFTPDLPRDILWSRRKIGFGAPLRTWLTGDLRDAAHDLLAPTRIRDRGLFDPEAVGRMLSAPLHDRNDYRIWALMTLEMWMQTFVDRRPADARANGPLRQAAA